MTDNLADLKKEALKLTNIQGNVKGDVLNNYLSYILYKEGRQGVEKLKNTMKELGWPINSDQFTSYSLQREAQGVLIILTAKHIFNWTEEDVFKMGYTIPRLSLIARIIIHFAVNIDKLIGEASRSWRKYYDFGDFKIINFDKKNKHIAARLTGYKFHPVMCTYLEGYFLRLIKYIIHSKDINIKETKCLHRGDPYHEFYVSWNGRKTNN